MSALDYEKISRYVDGEMTGDELQSFEQLLLQDNALKREVDQFKEVNDTLKTNLHPDEGELALRNTLEKLQQQYFKQQTKVISINKYRKWLAAAVAAAAILVILLWSPWKQDLYRQYASIEMTSSAVRGPEADSILQRATENFNEKKFAEAIPLFEALVQLKPESAYTRLHFAIALLESNQIERSRKELTTLYEGNSLFSYDAAFYMALSYLKEKDKIACKEWLMKIPADAAIYSKSQSLLKKL